MQIGYFCCLTGDDADAVLGSSNVALGDAEGLGCIFAVFPPTFGNTPTGIGKPDDKNSPWMGESTSSTRFLFIASAECISSTFKQLAAYTSSCQGIHCKPPSPWPTEFHSEEMARHRADAEARYTEAAIFQSNTLSEEQQNKVDQQTMNLTERHFRHLVGVRNLCLDQPDRQDPEKKWWWILWVLEYTMEELAEMYKLAAMRQLITKRLTRDLPEANITAICTGCKRKVKIEFNGDLTCDGQDHRNCRGPLANDVFEEILGSQTAGLDESKSSESQVTMKHDLPVHETFK